MFGTSGESTLIDQLLADQKQLKTPVAEFSDLHDRAPDLAENFKTLIPLTKPGKGEQYAFQVELDRCTGCKACVSACHSLNGLDEAESWRDVGRHVSPVEEPSFSQTVTSACHHCESPECLHGCPVGAYDKDEETGIVRHLDDQCIGCSYCILKCPFDVPKYSSARGIVRKCDMCHDRLAEGEAPACVQACPTEAIKIITVTQAETREPSALFSIPSYNLTTPTTRYTGREVPQDVQRADQGSPLPEHAHAPLIGMLSLTQVGAGLLSVTPFLLGNASLFTISLVGTLLVFAGLGVGALHLGQPLKVWRFFLGLRTSWLSREFLVFGGLTALAPLLCILSSPFTPDFSFRGEALQTLSWVTAFMALLAVFTSVMLYADTGRALWSFRRSAGRFYGTTVAAAFLTAAAVLSPWWVIPASLILVAKGASELWFVIEQRSSWSPDQHTVSLLQGSLRRLFEARLITLALCLALSPLSPVAGLVLLLITEALERSLFFTSVFAPRMTSAD